MASYDLPRTSLGRTGSDALDQQTLDALWELFLAIGDHWQNFPSAETARTWFATFLSNRIERDPSYALEYRLAVAVLAELKRERGKTGAYEFLLTDPAAGTHPPSTLLQGVRQRVSNEFIALQLSLGGFKAFSGEDRANAQGYIGGVSEDGRVPYRAFEE